MGSLTRSMAESTPMASLTGGPGEGAAIPLLVCRLTCYTAVHVVWCTAGDEADGSSPPWSADGAWMMVTTGTRSTVVTCA
jgi:hypothetical protein